MFPGAFGQVSHDGAFLSGIQYTGDSGGPAFRIHLRSGERREVGGTNLFNVSAASGASPSGRYVQGSTAFFGDFVYGSWTANFFTHAVVAFDGLDQWLVYQGADLAPQRGFEDLLAVPVATFFDNDEDGLNDHWELLFGLSPFLVDGAPGDNGPDGDPDHDGLTNAQEFAAGSNPVGTQKRFLAEGVSSPDFFSTRIAIVNPGSVDAKVAVRFDAGDGVGKSRALVVPARTRVTLDSHAEQMDGFSFSTVVDGDQPLVVDRLVSWGTTASGIYGSHAETSTAAPGTNWLLAEGSTVLGFQLFYLLQNPGDAAATATVRFLRPTGPPLVRTYELAPRSRTTLYVNTVPGARIDRRVGRDHGDAADRGGARDVPQRPGAAVRARTRCGGGAAGVDELVLRRRRDRRLLRHLPAARQSVFSERGGPGRLLARRRGGRSPGPIPCRPAAASASMSMASRAWTATAFGMRVTSSVPIVAERSMYWAGGFFNYYEGHVSAGATQTGSHWILAESEITATASGAVPRASRSSSSPTPRRRRVGPPADAAGDRRSPRQSSRAAADPGNARLTVSADDVARLRTRRRRRARRGDRSTERARSSRARSTGTPRDMPFACRRELAGDAHPVGGQAAGVQASFAASCCRNNPTSVTRPIV